MDSRKRVLYKVGRILSVSVVISMALTAAGCGKRNMIEPKIITKSYGDLCYEYDDELEMLPVDDSVKAYYENFTWDRSKAFDGLSKTVTHINSNNMTYDVHAAIKDETHYMSSIYGKDKDGVDILGEVRVLGDTSYLKVSSNHMPKDTYFTAPYDKDNTTLASSAFLEVYDLVLSMQSTEPDNDRVKIHYQGRTKLNDYDDKDSVTADNIVLSFYNDPEFTYVLFIDADTKKVIRISSSVVSGNDMTDLLYHNEDMVSEYSEADIKNSTNGEATKVDDDNISRLFDTICYGISNKDIDTDTNNQESEENDVE